MAGKGALSAGRKAPAISLETENGQKASLADALKNGPALVAFYKVNCPTCQLTLPFLERLYESYGDGKVTFWGVSQNDARDTQAFHRQYGVKFPSLVDSKGYPASNEYGLTNVPSIFWIAPDGTIQFTSVGFVKADLEKLGGEIARAAGKPAQPLFRANDSVPEFKPG